MYYSLLCLSFFLTSLGFADEAPLDPGRKLIVPVTEAKFPSLADRVFAISRPQNNKLSDLISLQTPVKSQGSRGTCSIFASMGHLESVFKIIYKTDLDLAENYLEYLVMAKVKSFPSEGSDIAYNVPAFRSYGAIIEELWPYEDADWAESQPTGTEAERAKEVCGDLADKEKQICLLAHMDPNEDPYAETATEFRSAFNLDRLSFTFMTRDLEIKDLLSKNYPVLLSLEFFYGAWNHRKMVEYGIGEIDQEKWDAGVVGVPTKEDIELSRAHPAGHVIVLVGYDDEKRVFYFKNSWGKHSFGVSSNLLGEGTTPGYGTIPYSYAYKHGTFYDVYLTNERGWIIRK